MTVLILHGIEGYAGVHWQQWLHDELMARGHGVIMPTLSDPDHPDRTQWLHDIKKAIRTQSATDLIIVGHSLSVASALDFIEKSDTPVHGLVSVSGFAYDYGAELNSYFLSERDIHFDAVRECLENAAVLFGDDDPYVPQDVLHDLAKELHVDPIIIPHGGHLNTAAGFTTFPKLLEVVEGMIH